MQTNNLDKKVGNKPLLSIITVVRNVDKVLEKTILSVINQSYNAIEYIIIDGGSTDGTVKIIKEYESNISYWVSEPDQGIYYAMNKAIKKATGQWMNFMNAGDEFFDLEICESIADFINVNSAGDVVYGDYLAINEEINSSLLVKAKPLNAINTRMIFCHQSVFVKKDLLTTHLFDTRYKIAADYKQMLSLYNKGYKFSYINKTISKISIGGLSYSNIDTLVENVKIVHSVKPYSVKILFFIPQFCMGLLRNLYGLKLTNLIRQYKWKYLNNRSQTNKNSQ